MKKRIIKLFGISLIIGLWLSAFLLFTYTLDKIQKSNNNPNHLDYTEKFHIDAPQYPMDWYDLTDFKTGNATYKKLKLNHEQISDGITVRLKPVYVKINSDGFRDREFSIEKPPNTFRIIMSGDSIPFGQGVEVEDTLPKQLESILNSRQNSWNYEVLNFGVPGHNIREEVEMFKDNGLKYNPDLLIIVFCVNDLDDDLPKWNQHYQENRGLKYYLTRFFYEVTLKFQDLGLKDKDWKGTIENPFEELVSISKNTNMNTLIYSTEGGNESYCEAAEALNKGLSNIADKYEKIYFGPADNINWQGQENLRLHRLDPHPTPLAHSLHAERVYKILIEQNLIPYDKVG